MNLLKRYFHWCCLIAGGVTLCTFVLGEILDNETLTTAAYAGASLVGLMAVAGWYYLRKPPQ